MLWICVKVGERVFIDHVPLTLVDKDRDGIVVSFEGETWDIARGESIKFSDFTLYAGTNPKGLRLGFQAPQSVLIRREKLETRFPSE